MKYFDDPVWVDADVPEPIGVTNHPKFKFGIRKFYESRSTGNMIPGKKGINFSPAIFLEVIKAMIIAAVKAEIISVVDLGSLGVSIEKYAEDLSINGPDEAVLELKEWWAEG